MAIHRERVDYDDDEYDEYFDEDVSDTYSRFVSKRRIPVKCARARACHLISLRRNVRFRQSQRTLLHICHWCNARIHIH